MRVSSGPPMVAFAALLWTQHVRALSWGIETKRSEPAEHGQKPAIQPSVDIDTGSRLPGIYAVAMRELQDLESEPFCHRIAARLLVNNCQLLDSKNDATVLTNSGREVRDFVDSYAASLAICDLERGSFVIPSGCSKFRETVLARIPASDKAHLHVSSRDIDSCLSGLAKSDSAWNTWVSYRHKSLRFCEAARADNEKAESVRLYKRLTEVLSSLTQGVEDELEQYLQTVNSKFQEATQQLDHLSPRVNRLRDGLDNLEQILSADVLHVIKDSAASVNDGLRDATALQQLISVLLNTVLDNNAAVAASHEHALQTVQRRTDDEISTVVAALAAAMASTTSLQDQMDASRLQAAELASRQNHLEHGMKQLITLADKISIGYENHVEMLDQAQSRTEDILGTLTKASLSAGFVQNSISNKSGWSSWWPYVVCPTASLIMGSYGLPPSAVRNLGLVALGELTGLVISSTQRSSFDLWQFWGGDAGFLELRTDTFHPDSDGFASITASVCRRNGTVRT